MRVQLRYVAAMLCLLLPSVSSLAQAPTITTRSPKPNSSRATPSSPISLRFSQPMSAASASGIFVYGSLTGALTLPAKGSFSQPTSQEILHKTLSEFRAGEKITIVVTSSVKSSSGVALEKPIVYDFTTAATSAPASFVSSAELSATPAPKAMGIGDFDGDKDMDLVVLTSEKVFIRLNNGKGNYSVTSSFTVDGAPQSVEVADVDRDGDVDLVIATNKGLQTKGRVSIRLNDGKGNFSGNSNLVVGLDPISVKVSDLNGDGFLDIAALNVGLGDPYNVNGTGSVSIKLNDKKGNFSGNTEIKVGYTPRDLQLADLDGDGDLDLATADIYHLNDPSAGSVSVRLNNGKGSFSGGTSYVFGYNVYGVQLADFDGDGDVDVLSAGTNIDSPYSYLSVLVNAGNSTFTKKTVSMPDFLLGVKNVHIADYDGDGDLDAAVVATTSANIALFSNIGKGNFTYSTNVTTSTQPISVLATDVDGNGTMDLACVQTGKVSILQNRFFIRVQVPTSYLCTNSKLSLPFTVNGKLSSTNVFTAQLSNAAGSFANPVAIGSLTSNASGTIPVVIPAGSSAGSAYRIRIVASEGTFPKEDNGTNLRLYTDCPSVIRINPIDNSAKALVSTNVTMTFSQPVSTSSASGAAINVQGSKTGTRTGSTGGSFSGGGTNTLVFNPHAHFRSNEKVSVTISKNTQSPSGSPIEKPKVYEFTIASAVASGSFKMAPHLAIDGNPYAICSADFDGDGDVDLAMANLESNQVVIRRNDGKGNMSGTASFTVGTRPVHILTADFDNDGDMDLATTSAAAGATSVRFNDGAGNFTGSTELVTGGGPTAAAVADLDADGDMDIAIANYFANTVSIRFNNGSGQFTGNKEISTGDSPAAVHFSDVDNDGDMDLLSATENNFDDHVWLSLNDGTGSFTPASALLYTSSRAIQTSDLDADGDMDLLVSTINGLAVLLNDGAAKFTTAATLSIGNLVSAADFDGDGDVDVVVVDNLSSTYAANLYLNMGKGSFGTPRQTNLTFEPIFLSTSDMDGNGTVDLALANGYNNNVSLLFNPLTVASTCTASGTILRESWTGVKGYSTTQVPVTLPPTTQSQLTSFEGPAEAGDYYGDRISGYICPPQSGDYTFWISGDDNSALYLSTDASPANKVRIAYLNGATNPRQWTKYATQRSASIYLETGKRYYIESLHKEATGHDHVAVGWQLPDGQLERPITGKRLSPFVPSKGRSEGEVEALALQPGFALTAWPNPFSDRIQVDFTTQEAGAVRLELYDLQGKLVRLLHETQSEAKVAKQVELNTQSLMPGLYLLRLINGSEVQQQKILLQR